MAAHRKKRNNCWSRRSRAGKLGIIAIFAIAAGLGIGFGVGFGVGIPSREKYGDARTGRPKPTQTSSAPPAGTGLPSPPPRKNIWQPAVGTPWQIVLPNAINIEPMATNTTPAEAMIWDIDLFINSKDTISTLHRLGKKVICYFSAGSYEPGRPDSGKFLDADKGKQLKGWPDEKWLDIRSANVRKIMEDRIKLAMEKGCDGIDPDNTDAYDNDNGLGLSPTDSSKFLSFLSQKAVEQGLSIGLKNSAAILTKLLPLMQWSVNEQCVQMEECDSYAPMISNSKPVFHIEYPSQVKGNARISNSFCASDGPASGAAQFSTVIKNDNLDGWVQYCDGNTATTA